MRLRTRAYIRIYVLMGWAHFCEYYDQEQDQNLDPPPPADNDQDVH